MQHPDEGTIHAWLDGALPDEEARAIGEHVASCAACGERVAEARGLMAGASRILSALDDAPAGVVPGGARSPGRVRRVPWWRRQTVGMAAAIMVVAFGTTMVVTRNWQGTQLSVSESITPTVIRTDSQASSVVAESTIAVPAEPVRAPASMSAEAPPPAAPVPSSRMALRQVDSQPALRALAAPSSGRASDLAADQLRESDERVAEQKAAAGAAAAERRREAVVDSIRVVRVDSLALRAPRQHAELESTEIRPVLTNPGAPAVVGGQTLTRTAASLAGCYSLELRQAGGHTLIDLPSTVELAASTQDAAAATNRVMRSGYAQTSRPFMVPPAVDTGQLGWRLASDDSVAIRLPAQRAAVLLTFPAEVTQPQLGLATTQALPGIPAASTPVLVRRVPCP